MNERGNYASSSVLYFFPAVFKTDVLLNMCKSSSKPDMDKLNALIKAYKYMTTSTPLYESDKLNALIKRGGPIRTKVRRN